MSSDRVNDYRRRVIDHVACPHCFAPIKQPCHERHGLQAQPAVVLNHLVPYVHDDRSAEFEQHQLTLIADRGLPSVR